MRKRTRWVFGSRRSGKTTEMVRWLAESQGRVLLCADEDHAEMLRHSLPMLMPKWSRNECAGVAARIRALDAAKPLRGLHATTEVAIDGLDTVLARLFGREIAAISADITYDDMTILPTRLIDAI